MTDLHVIQVLANYRAVLERAEAIVKKAVGECPESIAWPDDLSDPEALVEATYNQTILGNHFTEVHQFPLRELWEPVE